MDFISEDLKCTAVKEQVHEGFLFFLILALSAVGLFQGVYFVTVIS